MRKPLHRAAGAGALLLVALAIASTGKVGTTFAFFDGETSNASSAFAGGWIDPPTLLKATPSGYDSVLSWTPGTHGPVTGQQLSGVNNLTNPDCSGAAYTTIGSALTAGAITTTDASRGTVSNNGNWFCYQMVSTSATVWTAQMSTAMQLGLVANGVSTANAAAKCTGAPNLAAGTIDCNDKITITFNQKPIVPTGSIQACVYAPGTIMLGDTHGGTCHASNDSYSIGLITGFALGSTVSYGTSTATLSTTAPWTLTIVLAGSTGTSTVSGTGTFKPVAGILSSITTHQATICTSTSSTCQPTTSTNF